MLLLSLCLRPESVFREGFKRESREGGRAPSSHSASRELFLSSATVALLNADHGGGAALSRVERSIKRAGRRAKEGPKIDCRQSGQTNGQREAEGRKEGTETEVGGREGGRAAPQMPPLPSVRFLCNGAAIEIARLLPAPEHAHATIFIFTLLTQSG